MTIIRTSWIAALAVAAPMVAVAACSSSHPAGTSNRALGPPILLGMAVQENSPAGSMAEMRIAAQAAVDYVNNELGGIHGRPLELATCATMATAESNIACAHQLVDRRPIAILGGGDFLGAAALSVYQQAGLPIIGGAAFSEPELSYPNAVRFQGFSVAALPSAAAYIVDNLHAHRVAIVYTDSPVARADVPRFVRHVLVGKGLANSDVSVASGTLGSADWASVMTAAAATHPDVMFALTQGNTCIPILQARAQLAPTTKLVALDNCLDPRLLHQEGTTADGVVAMGLFVSPTSTSDPDVKTFLSKFAQYGGSQAPINALSQEGFSEVMNLWDVLHQAPASALTTTGILAPFKDGRAHHNFMGHDYTCDGHQVPKFPAVCDAHARVFTVHGSAINDDPSWVNGSGLIA
jgi:branched-chain amino acid transport system substrate-binding protein